MRIFVATTLFLFPSIIFAATNPESSLKTNPETTVQKKSDPIEEILVTADFSQRQQFLSPFSVSKLNLSDWQDVHIDHVSEQLNFANAWVSRGSGQEHLTAIRSPVFTGPGACGNFLISEDQIPVRSKGFCNVNQVFDAFFESSAAVEIFRGPMSSSRGGNALFGGIDFQSPDASRQFLNLNTGSNDSLRSTWNLGNSRFNSFGSVRSENSFRDQAGVDQQKLGFKHNIQQNRWQHTQSVFINNLEQETATFIEGKDSYKDSKLAQNNAAPEAYRDVQSLRAYSRSTFSDGTTQVSITPYLRVHEMAFLMHFVPWQPTETNEHRSVGITTTLNHQASDQLTLLSGIEAEYTEGALKEQQDSPAPFAQDRFPQGTHYDYRVENQSLAIFGSAQYQLTPRATLNAGMRFDVSHYDYDNRVSDGFACATGVTGCRFFRPSDKNDNFEDTSWRFSFDYLLSENWFAYANYATAFRAPQAAELYRLQSDQQLDLKSVKLENTELGLRKRTKTARINIALFNMWQTDGIYQDNQRSYITGAESSHKGLEYELYFQALPTLEFMLAGQYAEHTYENNPLVLGANDAIAGNDIDTAPRHSHHQKIRWQAAAKHALTLISNYQGEYYLDPDNSHLYSGHWIQNVAYAYQISSGYKIGITINNIRDTRYAQRADFAFGEYRYFPADGRSFNLSLNLNF